MAHDATIVSTIFWYHLIVCVDFGEANGTPPKGNRARHGSARDPAHANNTFRVSHQPEEPALGASRARVLRLLQKAREPIGVAAVAQRMRLHENTARFHLDALVGAGLATRALAQRKTPGRPAAVYQASHAEPDDQRRNYRLLAKILASSWTRWVPEPEHAALRSGEAWGRYLTDRPAPYESVDRETAMARLLELLDDLGFAPEHNQGLDAHRLLLRDCPFLETAAEDPHVVCAVHLGLMRGALTELNAPLEVTSLDPFVEPSLCVARLSPRPDPASPPEPREA